MVPATSDFPHREVAQLGDSLSVAAFDGLEFAFWDRVMVRLSGNSLSGDSATAEIYCCGPASYVILKTKAYLSREENKDIYDLIYMLRFWPGGIAEIARQLQDWRDNEAVSTVIRDLSVLFADLDSLGPESYAEFRVSRIRYVVGEDAAYAFGAEAHSTIMQLLRHLQQGGA